MDPERWRRLKELFEGALALDPAERDEYLERRCSGDAALRREAGALLANYESGDDFLERPAHEAAAHLFEEKGEGGVCVGERLGPYALKGKLGEGGMGVVYLAEDTRLGREVALKVLPPRLASDERFRARLRREALAVASLSHPGIATLFALEEIEGSLCLVREYVHGRTLREELSSGPLPPGALLECAVRIVRALAAAHAQGIIHRDLKPENVIRTDSGETKILDFGLARFQGAQRLRDSLSEPRLTKSGAFVGTPAYASPEQLLGSGVDFRTDIFSLGVLLFELASGVHPFAAPDPISSIARIFEADSVDLSPVDSGGPPGLGRILRRCLHKDPARRYGSTGELAADLEALRAAFKGSRTAEPGEMETGGPGSNAARLKPLWWWRFHQAAVGIIYYGMLYPLWKAREWMGSPMGDWLFFAALIAVAVASNLRFHLWFTSVFYPAELQGQLRRSFRWIRGADVAFVFLLAAGGAAILRTRGAVAALLIAVAIGCLVQCTLIEPTTTRAAFAPEKDDGVNRAV